MSQLIDAISVIEKFAKLSLHVCLLHAVDTFSARRNRYYSCNCFAYPFYQYLGYLFQPVVLARPPVLQQTTLNHYTEPGDPGQSKRRAVQGSNSIHSEGASMIREETIPDEYRKFIKPSTKKRRVTEAYRDKVCVNLF